VETTYIVAAMGGTNKIWETAPTLGDAFILGSSWRAAGLTSITVAAVVPYAATIHIVAGDQVFDLPVPDVPSEG
jgi:hypothetical protein